MITCALSLMMQWRDNEYFHNNAFTFYRLYRDDSERVRGDRELQNMIQELSTKVVDEIIFKLSVVKLECCCFKYKSLSQL